MYPQIHSSISDNPMNSALLRQTQSNQKLQSLINMGGKKRKHKKGGTGLEVPLLKTSYPSSISSNQNIESSQIKMASNLVNNQENSKYDKFASLKGGKSKRKSRKSKKRKSSKRKRN
jgi:hypothetical protein